jgi:HEAT repeats
VHKQFRIVVGILAAVLAGVILWFWVFQQGPHYEGKSPDYWMNYDYRVPRPDLKFQEVWNGLGPNPVPFLINALQRKEQFRPGISYRSIWRALPAPFRVFLPRPSPPAHVVRCRAASALGQIGTGAKAAIPILAQTAKTDQSALVREAAARARQQIEP